MTVPIVTQRLKK
jgi:hypothetical protein